MRVFRKAYTDIRRERLSMTPMVFDARNYRMPEALSSALNESFAQISGVWHQGSD
jgi:hypothetical protein